MIDGGRFSRYGEFKFGVFFFYCDSKKCPSIGVVVDRLVRGGGGACDIMGIFVFGISSAVKTQSWMK